MQAKITELQKNALKMSRESPSPDISRKIDKPKSSRFTNTVFKAIQKVYKKPMETQLLEYFAKLMILLDKSIEHDRRNVIFLI